MTQQISPERREQLINVARRSHLRRLAERGSCLSGIVATVDAVLSELGITVIGPKVQQ